MSKIIVKNIANQISQNYLHKFFNLGLNITKRNQQALISIKSHFSLLELNLWQGYYKRKNVNIHPDFLSMIQTLLLHQNFTTLLLWPSFAIYQNVLILSSLHSLSLLLLSHFPVPAFQHIVYGFGN